MDPTIKIIDNKKIALTEAEWQLYQSIHKSYDRTSFKGEDLFKNLFETDESGTIIFLIPPNGHYTSMEVYLFIVSIMVHQHVRNMNKSASLLMKSMEDRFNDKMKMIKKELKDGS